MERSKALIASALVAASLTVGAGVYVAGSGLLAGATDNVGNLQPTVATTAAPAAPAAPQEITVYVDQATGAATTVAPQAAPVQAAPVETAPVEAAAPAEVAVDNSGTQYQGDDESDDHGEDRSDGRESEERGEEDD